MVIFLRRVMTHLIVEYFGGSVDCKFLGSIFPVWIDDFVHPVTVNFVQVCDYVLPIKPRPE